MSTLAETADKYRLYEQSVQCVEAEIDFVDATFHQLRGYEATTLREDFCGTAQTSIEWVQRRPGNYAVSVDLDPAVLAWCRQYSLVELDNATRARLALVEADVMQVPSDVPQMVLAMNFSYQLFDTRLSLLAYFRKVYEDLSEDGIFFLDAYGGYESYKIIQEETEHGESEGGFTYIWDQASYNPINGRMQCYIHFAFPDGSRLDQAFSYQWRMWTLPELQELLHEAGFCNVTVYWEGTDKESGEGNGIYSPASQGDADAAWICYLSAQR